MALPGARPNRRGMQHVAIFYDQTGVVYDDDDDDADDDVRSGWRPFG